MTGRNRLLQAGTGKLGASELGLKEVGNPRLRRRQLGGSRLGKGSSALSGCGVQYEHGAGPNGQTLLQDPGNEGESPADSG